jgi:hypothetical protein
MFHELATDGWANQTLLHPLGLALLVLCGVATFIAPRRYALVPMLVLVCLVASAQRVVVATLDFNFLRIIILFAWARILLRNECSGWRWKLLDTAVSVWVVVATSIALMLQPTPATLINRLGLMYDAVGLYFVVRILVRDWRDVRSFAVGAAFISIPVAIAFLIEHATGRNMFAIFGGVPEITTVRDGRLRCRGPFAHPIVAGTFWVALMPLIGALWFYRGWLRVLACAGLVCGSIVVVTCASATPIGGLIAGLIALAAFPLRRHLALLRWGAVAGILVLQLMMTNPIWHLLSRMSFVEGATGWYRYKLIDDFIRHFGDWWLMGTVSREGWFADGVYVITNQYVLQGVDGGLITLVLFLLIIACAFAGVGRLWRRTSRRRLRAVIADGTRPVRRPSRERRHGRISPRLAMAWALGSSLFILCGVFIAVSLFAQVTLVWYIVLGFIGSLTPTVGRMRVFRTRPVIAHEQPPQPSTATGPAPAPAL